MSNRKFAIRVGYDTFVKAPLPQDLVWFHAVNSIAKVDALIRSVMDLVLAKKATSEDPIPIAIEVDIHCVNLDQLRAAAPNTISFAMQSRYYPSVWTKNAQDAVCCCPGDVAVTRHDAAPPSTSSPATLQNECTLHDLFVHLRTQLAGMGVNYRNRFEVLVVKLDTKSPRALRATYYEMEDLHLMDQTFPMLHRSRVWYNADVLRGPISIMPVPVVVADSAPPSRELTTTENTLTDSIDMDSTIEPKQHILLDTATSRNASEGGTPTNSGTGKCSVSHHSPPAVEKQVRTGDEALCGQETRTGDEALCGQETSPDDKEYLYLRDLHVKDPFTKWAYDEMVQWLVRIGHQSQRGLSLGWTTQPDLFDGYTEDDVFRMRQLLVDMRGGPAPVITFPVRYSLVFPSLAHTTAPSAADASAGEEEEMSAAQSLKEAPVQALRQLLLSVAASGFASSTFLTFWRGRTETLDASDVARIYEYFPSATVDRD
jgi:hypothetical protein